MSNESKKSIIIVIAIVGLVFLGVILARISNGQREQAPKAENTNTIVENTKTEEPQATNTNAEETKTEESQAKEPQTKEEDVVSEETSKEKEEVVASSESQNQDTVDLSAYKLIDYGKEYLLPASTYRYLDQDDLKGMDAEQARIARNEIYAIYGRRFASEDLKSYFSSKSWYHPMDEGKEFDEAVLNKFAKENIKLIKQYEDDGCPSANETTTKAKRTVGFVAMNDQQSNEVYLEYTSDTEGRFVLVKYGKDENGNTVKDDSLIYTFSEDSFGKGQVYSKTGEQLNISYNIVYEKKNYDEYHYEINVNYLGENLNLTEANWANIRN